MNWRAVRTVIRKDLTVVRRSRTILLPMILLPLLLQVVLPAGIGLGVSLAPASFTEDADVEALIRSAPPSVGAELAGLDEGGKVLVLFLVYAFAPLFLIVPMMVSSVIAADSFVGERERKTLEALLHSPITDFELGLAKTLSAWLAALAVTWASFLLYGIVVNALGWSRIGGLFFPNSLWVVLVLWVAPAVAGLGLASMVLISSRVSTFQEAYQTGGIIVVPLVGLVIGQVTGVLFLSAGIAAVIGLVVWVLDAALIWYGVRTLRREELLARL